MLSVAKILLTLDIDDKYKTSESFLEEVERAAKQNPDLPISFIANTLISKKEADSGNISSYKRRT